MRGTRKNERFASSTPLEIADGTSLAFPEPTPTLPSPSPTTTSAVKLKRRPPLTTLETRLMVTTRSMNLHSGSLPRRLLSRRPLFLSAMSFLRSSSRLQGQATLSGAVGHRRNATAVLVSATVEDDRLDACRLGALK